MASFDRSVPPGGEGKIVLKIDTQGYYGDVTKKARIYTNDISRRVQTVSIKATVKTSIYINPASVFFKGELGKKMERVIQITAKEEKVLKINAVQFDLEKLVSVEIKEIEEGRQYQLIFTTTPEVPGVFRGRFKLTTNYPDKPEITIPVRGTIQKPLQTENPKKDG